MKNDPTRKLMRQMLGAVSEYDKNQIVLKLRGARMRKRAAEGRCEGRKPFGRDAEEQKALVRMRALRGDGLSFDKIAERLNEEGAPTRTGKRWHVVVVNRILTGKKQSGVR
jgi:DNA invertase Pin-like site-specific DNA recombinase